MTLPPDDLGDLLDITPEAEAPEVETPETPEVVEAAAPEAPAAPDPWEKINRLAELQAQQIELQRAQMERAAAPPPPAAWVDPYDRPENSARLEQLEEDASWNPEARKELGKLRRTLDDERLDYRVSQRETALRQELQAASQVQQVQGTLLQEARQYGELVDETALNEVMGEVFAGQADHVRANALQDPALRQLIVQAAAGRRVLAGEQRPPNAPARAPAPPTVQSVAAARTAPSKAGPGEWADPEYMNSALEAAYGKAFK